MKFAPKTLILLGHGEHTIYKKEKELQENFINGKTELITAIGDIRDKGRMFELIDTYYPSIIYHAAAHKHVPLMEDNPHEAVKNNIIGTKNVAEVASSLGVERLMFVSTDKAVNPTNVMGATARIAEMIIKERSEDRRVW